MGHPQHLWTTCSDTFPKVSSATLGGTLPDGDLSPQSSWGHSWSTGSSLGLPSKRHMDFLECVQWKATRIISCLEVPSYEQKLRELELFSLEKRRHRERFMDLYIMCINTWRRGTKDNQRCPVSDALGQDKRQWAKTEIWEISLQYKKKSFNVRMVKHSRLPVPGWDNQNPDGQTPE